MSQVVEEGDGTYRVRRQRRSMIVLAIVLLSLAGAFYYASSYFRETTPQPGPCTTVVAAPPLKPADVSINVFNATSRRGLALSTSKVAAQRGFKIASVGNDPQDKTIKDVAHIRYGPEGEESAKLLAQHIKGAKLIQDKRKGDKIDLALGTTWKGFGPVPTPTTQAPTLPPCPTITVEG